MAAAFDIVLEDGTRIPVDGEMTIGRAPGSSLQLTDPSVSRQHARISLNAGAPVLRDAGSSYGTWIDGRRVDGAVGVQDGSRIRMGDQELLVERHRGEDEAGRTIVVPVGASLMVPRVGDPSITSATTNFGDRPRLRSGYALKRLEASEGPRRWVLKDLTSGRFVSFTDSEAELLRLFDGRRSLADLVREAEKRFGDAGPARLAELLADVATKGLLAGVAVPGEDPPPATTLQRLLKPREHAWSKAGDWFLRLYRAGGWVLLTRPVLVVLAVLAVAGVAAFVYLIAGRYGTPFVVASKIGLGGLVFVVGRLAVAAVHETAHALTMASFGRRVARAGVKLVLVFPYVFVDTSDAWFEPRRRRIAVSAAGPVSDFSLGALFAICSAALPPGTVRDIFFQLAFGAYIGGLFNLNPFLERDGYHILVDLLREPGLRERAREELKRRLRGESRGRESSVIARYSLYGLAWSLVAACFAVALSIRYEPRLASLLPRPAAWFALAMLWLTFFTPVLLAVGGPLRERARAREG